MNILLLGSTGYLGMNLVQKLVGEGYNLICVIRSTSDTSRIKNLGVSFVSNNLEDIEVVFKDNQIDWVINCVCTYKPNHTFYEDILVSNLYFPLSVLNLAIKYGVKNYITIGTSLPSNLNVYSFAKNKFGEFGEYICDQHAINFADLRLEMFYGGLYEPGNRFIKFCIEKLKNDENLELTTGLQKRDIIRMEDVTAIISKIISSSYVKGYMRLPIGSGEQYSIKEIIEFMKEKMNSKSELLFGIIPSRDGEPDTLADILWYKDLDYELQYQYFEGIWEACNSSFSK